MSSNLNQRRKVVEGRGGARIPQYNIMGDLIEDDPDNYVGNNHSTGEDTILEFTDHPSSSPLQQRVCEGFVTPRESVNAHIIRPDIPRSNIKWTRGASVRVKG